MPTVSTLSIAPVKGMSLHHPDEITVEPFGVSANRRFYLVNERGRLFNGSRNGALVTIRADHDEDRGVLRLTFPDGAVCEGEVRATGRQRSTNFWGRPVPAVEVEGPWNEALSRFVGEQVFLLTPERPGEAVDSHAVSLISTASVRELAARIDAEVDARRFRMLVEIDGTAPHEEDTWVGRRVRIGQAVIEVIRPDPRCRITTQNPDTGEADLDTLGALKAYRGKEKPFGVYADVVHPGRIRVGDDVELLESVPAAS
jgi:hypothetical protein